MEVRLNRVNIASTNIMREQITTVVGAVRLAAIHPIRRAPMGIPPWKTRIYKLITRPRNSSGTSSCTMALEVLTMVINPHPIPTSRRRESGRFRVKENRNRVQGAKGSRVRVKLRKCSTVALGCDWLDDSLSSLPHAGGGDR